MLDLELIPKPPWALIAPDGRVWQDTDPKELLRVLAVVVYANAPFRLQGDQHG